MLVLVLEVLRIVYHGIQNVSPADVSPSVPPGSLKYTHPPACCRAQFKPEALKGGTNTQIPREQNRKYMYSGRDLGNKQQLAVSTCPGRPLTKRETHVSHNSAWFRLTFDLAADSA